MKHELLAKYDTIVKEADELRRIARGHTITKIPMHPEHRITHVYGAASLTAGFVILAACENDGGVIRRIPVLELDEESQKYFNSLHHTYLVLIGILQNMQEELNKEFVGKTLYLNKDTIEICEVRLLETVYFVYKSESGGMYNVRHSECSHVV